MLEGSLTKPLFQFAIPVALIGILQQMFNTADIMVLGRYVGTEALAAVGNNAPVIGVMVNLFLGISLGANVLIARRLGGRQLKEASGAVHTTVLMALLTGLFILVAGEILAGPLMVWMGVPEEVRAASEFYLRIYLLGMPGMTLYDFLSAIYRSHGNVRTPLLSLITASLVNITGNFLAVFLGFGLAGVVVATAVANYVSSGLLLRMLRYEHGVLHFYPGAVRIRWEDIREILRVGVPAGIQGMVFNLSNMVIQSAINSEGALAMAASAAAYVLEINSYPFIIAFGQAITTFTSQNLGAGNLKRCREVVRRGLCLNFLFTCGLIGLVFLEARLLPGNLWTPGRSRGSGGHADPSDHRVLFPVHYLRKPVRLPAGVREFPGTGPGHAGEHRGHSAPVAGHRLRRQPHLSEHHVLLPSELAGRRCADRGPVLAGDAETAADPRFPLNNLSQSAILNAIEGERPGSVFILQRGSPCAGLRGYHSTDRYDWLLPSFRRWGMGTENGIDSTPEGSTRRSIKEWSFFMESKQQKVLRLVFLSMMIGLGVVISPILRVEGMCPMAHLINITCSVMLGPWYSLLCATLIGIIRMTVMGIPPLALTGAVFGAALSGIFYRASGGKIIAACLGEVIGTGVIGAMVSYPVMEILMGRTGLSWMFYVPSFIAGTLIGGSIAFGLLTILSRNGTLLEFQRKLGVNIYDRGSHQQVTQDLYGHHVQGAGK